MKKVALMFSTLALFMAGVASAHVTVSPKEVGVGKFQNFSISVPSEQDSPTVSLRLVLPDGLEHVSPTVKPGWNVKLVKGEGSTVSDDGDGDGDVVESDVVKEIVWSGGSIPAEFRDDFTFSAKVPATATTLTWKAYQTYKNGAVVSWEVQPGQPQPKKEDGTDDFASFGPASQTKVINDLTPATKTVDKYNYHTPGMIHEHSLIISAIALAISLIALIKNRKRSQEVFPTSFNSTPTKKK